MDLNAAWVDGSGVGVVPPSQSRAYMQTKTKAAVGSLGVRHPHAFGRGGRGHDTTVASGIRARGCYSRNASTSSSGHRDLSED